ncbi:MULTISPECIES: murein biosynthesis integral membrane protein MurJ [Micromonospora]|uniref:Murein biosynthesis integral membrane protein MurJ n=1 Tax=Micromonospora solifontis TaxID=2487138 RepID=A0ABX9WCX2_9ACTN|nr:MULTISPECIES: murein biosynthesis integral membrane protein MurJ [Micromonospora]NES16244.1 murein biosynthesis integral membrane protein MurJ [Micromonospora sp. PPF5-17B]NES38101.1 murein biosynthesis integral membrane protein MurJ [Micromonospora solifontis]NES57853.1 murein biosynthesis integral membrane protein MurJ [Micromonospora sp. PPF5-6]RNL97037.1 murein biosynthesis integral membrane protein MurJ [Micromonospora solifontis]
MSGGLYRSANAHGGGQPPDDTATFISAEPLNQPGAEATAPPQEVVAETSAAANSAVMAIGSLVSRGTGFIRNLMIGAALGGALVGDAYTTALFLPNQVYEFLLGGVLTSVLIPVLVRRRKTDPDRGEAYSQRLLTLAVLALAATALIAMIGAPVLTAIYASGKDADYTGLVNGLSYLMLPMLFFTGVSALIAAVLNTRGHFAAPMWAPILNNLVVIGVCALYIAVFGAKIVQPHEMGWERILLIGGGTLLGVAVQTAGLLPALRKVGFRWKWRFDFRALGLRELARLGGWMFCYVGVNQLGLFVVVNLLTRAAGGKNAGLLIYNNVFLLLMMAHGIIAVSIITALMPRMSGAAAEGRFRDVTADLSRGTRMVTAVLAPIAVCYAVLAGPISVVVFRYGAFTGDNAVATSTVLLVAALGLVPFAISQLFTFAFYALPDTRTPALVNIPVVALRVLLQVGLFLAFSATFAAAGMMLGNAVSYVAAAIISAMLLRPRVGRIGLGGIMRTMGRVVVAALGAALVGLLVVRLLPGDPAHLSWLAAAVQLIIGGAVIGATYLGLAMVLKIGEITEVVGMVRRRLGR